MTKQEMLDSMEFGQYKLKSKTIDDLSYGSLARALFLDVEWFFDEQEGDYQGDWYMVGKDKEGKYYFFTMGYGSCSECDWLQSIKYHSNEEKMKQEMSELIDQILDTPVIPNKEAAIEYAKKFDWRNSYDEGKTDPFVNSVVKAIEAT